VNIGTLITKLVNEKKIDWDEHLHIVLYAYQTTFNKMTTYHTPLQLVYGLHPLMLVEYLFPTTLLGITFCIEFPMVLNSRIIKLDEAREEIIVTIGMWV
jgi:hypothetical protein